MEKINSFEHGFQGIMVSMYLRDILYWKIRDGVLYQPVSTTGVTIEGHWFEEHYKKWLEFKEAQLVNQQP